MFRSRAYDEELIDDFNVSGDALIQNLRELHTINSLLGGYDINFNGLKKYLKMNPGNAPLTLMDIGCGGGDNLKVIAKFLRKRGVKAELMGLDANPAILEYAEKNCRDYPEIHFIEHNALKPLSVHKKPQIVFFTLFFHHFRETDIQLIIQNCLNAGAEMLVINDLHRNFLAYYSIKFLTTLFSKSHLVKNDAPLSVLRGFSKKELDSLLSGIPDLEYVISWKWAFRWKVLIFEKR